MNQVGKSMWIAVLRALLSANHTGVRSSILNIEDFYGLILFFYDSIILNLIHYLLYCNGRRLLSRFSNILFLRRGMWQDFFWRVLLWYIPLFFIIFLFDFIQISKNIRLRLQGPISSCFFEYHTISFLKIAIELWTVIVRQTITTLSICSSFSYRVKRSVSNLIEARHYEHFTWTHWLSSFFQHFLLSLDLK